VRSAKRGLMSANLRIDGSRLLGRLAALADIGATPEGGCRRLALSDEDLAGRDWLVAEMRAIGLETRIDAIGNIIGILPGTSGGPSVILGSHIDTVATGGKYDGALGVVAGLEVLATLRDAGITPHHPMAVIAFTNEEGARFQPDMLGSFVWGGGLPLPEALAQKDADGAVLGEQLVRIGYAGPEKPGFLKARAYFELHIEQGPVLEQESVQIGAVTGVQGITWLEMTIGGEPRHGGTTPMKYRRDAGLLAARINLFAHEQTRLVSNLLANMGFVRMLPGNVNVVPEQVVCTLDLRNPDQALLDQAEQAIRTFAAEEAAKAGLSFALRDLARFPPTPFDPAMIGKVEQAAGSLGLSCRRIISGAGHDAQIMAGLCPTGMIFIPSIGGLSHNPKEFSTDADIMAGANVLLQVALDAAMASDNPWISEPGEMA
jgi:N-carbamoyl-L-amino-acid hydrolase